MIYEWDRMQHEQNGCPNQRDHGSNDEGDRTDVARRCILQPIEHVEKRKGRKQYGEDQELWSAVIQRFDA